VSEQVL
jgi:uncharacterized FlaG/YvyC family protein